jgi:ABC-type amino acid transport substrate-binding protein
MIKKKWLAVGFVLVLSLLILVGCGQNTKTGGGEAEGEEKQVWVVGTSADYEPFEFVDENGDFVGYDIDLIKEIAARLDVELQIEDMEFNSLIASLQQGRIDAVIAAISPNPERLEQADFTIPYHQSKQAVLVKSGSDIEVNDFDDLLGYSIAVQTGTTMDEWATAKIEAGELAENQLFRYSDANAAAKDVEIGRVDVFLLDLPPARAHAKVVNVDLIYEGKLPDTENSAIAIPKGDTEMAEKLNAIINELIEEGFIEQLEDKWLT